MPAHRKIVVEDVGLQEGEETRFCRRLVFVSNRNLIQSEALLQRAANGAAKKQGAASQGAQTQWQGLEIDHSSLGMDYHCHIAAALSTREPPHANRNCTTLNIERRQSLQVSRVTHVQQSVHVHPSMLFKIACL